MLSLDGKWYSKLGSWMEFKIDNNGNITGTYHTAIGKMTAPLAGRYDTNGGTAFGWNATWPKSKQYANSSTSWAAFMHTDHDDKKDVILSSWMIREPLQYDQNHYKSTVSGCEEYTREKPTEDEIRKEMSKMGRQPHPIEG